MKKILALVLALTLVLGTFSFAAAAPEDVVGTDFEDAVGKLTYLGIIAGFPDGTYRPAEPVTRAQFAKIIVTALGVGEAAQYAAGTTKFSDVPADHWAAGYINVAVDLGIINGYPDGTFAPENSVTYAEAIKMIVAALGYTPKAEAMGGYPGGYLAIAAEKEISDGVTVVGALAANRGDIALMINNALDVPMMVQKTWGQFPEYEEDEDQNLLKKLGVDEIEGRVIAIPRVDSKLDDDEIKIDGEDGGIFEVVGAVDFELAFGNEVTAYVKKDKVIGLTIESDYFLDAIKWDGTKKELTLVEQDEDYDLAEDDNGHIAAVIYANGVKKAAKSAPDAAYDYAKVVLNDDGDVIFIDGYQWDGIIVVEEVDDEIVAGYGDELDVEDYVIVKEGKAIALEDIEAGDILFYKESAEFAEVYNVSYTGKIERVYDDSFKLDDDEFDFGFVQGNTLYVDDDELGNFNTTVAKDMMDEGEDATVFVDRYGDAVLVIGDVGEAETSSFYAMVVEKMVETPYKIRNKDYFNLDVINEEGEELNYDVAAADVTTWSIAGLDVGDVVKIEVEEDGDLDVVAKQTKKGPFGGTPKFEVDDSYVGGYRLQKSAVVFNVEDIWDGAAFETDFDLDDIVVSTFGELEFDEIKSGYVFVNNKGAVVAVVVYESNREADEEIYTAVAVADAKKVSGENTWKLEVNINGEVKVYDTKKDAFNDTIGDPDEMTIKEGHIVKLTVDENSGLVTDFTDVTATALTNQVVVERNTRDMTIKVDPDGVIEDPSDPTDDVLYRLDDATILDATDDYEVLGIRDLDVGNKLTILLIDTGSDYAKYVIRTAK